MRVQVLMLKRWVVLGGVFVFAVGMTLTRGKLDTLASENRALRKEYERLISLTDSRRSPDAAFEGEKLLEDLKLKTYLVRIRSGEGRVEMDLEGLSQGQMMTFFQALGYFPRWLIARLALSRTPQGTLSLSLALVEG